MVFLSCHLVEHYTIEKKNNFRDIPPKIMYSCAMYPGNGGNASNALKLSFHPSN